MGGVGGGGGGGEYVLARSCYAHEIYLHVHAALTRKDDLLDMSA